MLDNHVSVEQINSIRNLKNDSILITCVLKCIRLFEKAHTMFDLRSGALRGGRGGNLPSPLMAFLTNML